MKFTIAPMLVCLPLAVGCQDGAYEDTSATAQDAVTANEKSQPTTEANKAVVRDFFSLLNKGSALGPSGNVFIDEGFTKIDDGASWWIPLSLTAFPGQASDEPARQGLQALSKLQYKASVVGSITAGFGTSFRLNVLEDTFTAEGDRVAVEGTSIGEHLVTGKSYRNRYHFKFRVRDGKIMEIVELLDTLHLVGVMTPG